MTEKKERNEIIWILAAAPRKATVRALFLSLILISLEGRQVGHEKVWK